MKIKISDITIGTRHRKDLGDIEALAQSIERIGLLHPPVVDEAFNLIVGARRVAAVKSGGGKEIEVTVAKTFDEIARALEAERDENTCRKDFTPTEAVALAKALEPYERKEAESRQRSGKPSPKLDEGRTDDKIADAVGMGRSTLNKARAVADAAKSDPLNFGDLPAKMDATRKVDPVFREAQDRAEKLPPKSRPAALPPRPPRPASSRWATNIAECIKVFQSIRENGGIGALVDSWRPDERADYRETLVEFRDELNEWIPYLEKSCKTRKSA